MPDETFRALPVGRNGHRHQIVSRQESSVLQLDAFGVEQGFTYALGRCDTDANDAQLRKRQNFSLFRNAVAVAVVPDEDAAQLFAFQPPVAVIV